MRTWKLLLLGLCLLGLPAVVQAQFTYTTNNGAITITSYTGTDGNAVIPPETNGYPVTSIAGFGDGLGYAYSPTNIAIPASVTNIASGVFANLSSLTAITVAAQNIIYSSTNGILFDKLQTFLIQAPGGIAGSYAIPGSVTGIGDEAFYDCASLTNVSIGTNVTSIGDFAFSGCQGLTSLTIPNQVLSIGNWSFQACASLTNITLGTNVASVGDYAFSSCSGLTEFMIPNSVTNIGNEALEFCGSLTNVSLGTGVTTIGNDAFAYCSSLTRIVIPKSVTNIASITYSLVYVGGGRLQLIIGPIEMVAHCGRLTDITVDGQNPAYSSVNGILFNKAQTTLLEAPGAFAGSYTVPGSVTSIGGEAFQNCGGLTTVSIPNGVTNIGSSAFAACGSLTAIAVDAQNPDYSSTDGILFDKLQTTLIQFPGGIGGSYAVGSGIVSLGSAAFSGCTNLTRITIPASVTNVGNATFANASQAGIYFAGNAPVVNVWGGFGLIPGPTISLLGNNFYNPDAEAVYYLPGTTGWGAIFDGVTAYLWVPPYVCTPASNSITINGFTGSGGAITIPEVINGLPVTALASGLFDNATGFGLTNITLGTNLTTIGSYAFAACANLNSLTIPSGVTNLGSYAFTFCDNLQSVYFQGNAPEAATGVFFQWDGYPFLPIAPGSPSYEPPTPTTVYYLPGTTGWGSTFDNQPAVLWNPQVQAGGAGFGRNANLFGFNITGASNLVVVVEACANLAAPDWQPVQTNTLAGGSAWFSDPQSTNYPGRFYRLRPALPFASPQFHLPGVF